VFAKDMERMTAFYGGVLGLPRAPTADDSADFVSFDAGGTHLSLHALPAAIARTIAIADPPAPRENAATKIAFRADDVEAVRAHLVARGARFGSVHRYGGLHLCDGTDPEGNVIQLSNRP
jgi:catechol 2,3-dioxygenase-like lactoylglutathione lyase family enzyme